MQVLEAFLEEVTPRSYLKGEYELVMLSKYGTFRGGGTACAKIWIQPTSRLVWLEKNFENEWREMSQCPAYFLFLDSLPPVPFQVMASSLYLTFSPCTAVIC